MIWHCHINSTHDMFYKLKYYYLCEIIQPLQNTHSDDTQLTLTPPFFLHTQKAVSLCHNISM